MNTFLSLLEDVSLQQKSQGQLPKGLLKEIQSARELGKNLFKKIDRHQIQKIDREVYKNPHYYPEDILCDFSKLQLYSRWLPKIVGGGGGHPLAFYGLNMEMGAHCLGISNLLGAHYVALGLVTATSSFAVLSKITNDILTAEKKGTHATVALAITEPGAGTDMEEAELLKKANVCTYARKTEGGYTISGQKIFISNSLFAKWYIVSAFCDLKNPAQSLIIFAVKADRVGVSLGRSEIKLGQSASPANVLFFENVFIPDEDICFAQSQFKDLLEFQAHSEMLLNDLLSLSRAGVGCLATGVQKRILEIMVEASLLKNIDQEWAKLQMAKVLEHFIISKTVSWEGHIECYSRGPYKNLHSSFGYAFFKFLPKIFLQNFLGTLLKTPSARQLVRKNRRQSTTAIDEKMIFGWGSLTKSVCTDKAMQSALLALEFIGCDGGEYFWELEKMVRDIKLLQIYEGTNEINRLMVYKNFIGGGEMFKESDR